MVVTQYQVKWFNHSMQLLSRLGYLLEHEILVDVTLMCNENSLKVHRSVLAACSPYFEHVLQRELGDHPLIVLKDIHFGVLRSLIEFIYYGETNITEENLSSFIEAAKFFEIKGLSNMSIPVNSKAVKKANPFTSDSICIVSGFNNNRAAASVSNNAVALSASSASSSSSLSSSPTASSSVDFSTAACVKVPNHSEKIGKKRHNRGNSLSLNISDDSSISMPHAEESAKILLSLADSGRNFHLFSPEAIDTNSVADSNYILLNGNTRDSLNETPNSISNCEPSESGYKSDSVSSSLDSFTNVLLSSKSDTESSCSSFKFQTSPTKKLSLHDTANSLIDLHYNTNSNNFRNLSIPVDFDDNATLTTIPNNDHTCKTESFKSNILYQNAVLDSRNGPPLGAKIINASENVNSTGVNNLRKMKLIKHPETFDCSFIGDQNSVTRDSFGLNWDNAALANSTEVPTIDKFDLNDAEVISLTDGIQKQFAASSTNRVTSFSSSILSCNKYVKDIQFVKCHNFKSVKPTLPAKESDVLNMNDTKVLENIRKESFDKEIDDPEAVTLFRHNSEGKLEKFIISSKEIQSLKLMNEQLRRRQKEPPTNAAISEIEISLNKPDGSEKPLIARIIDYKNNSETAIDEIILKKLPFKKADNFNLDVCSWENCAMSLDLCSSLVHSKHHHENMLEELDNQFRNENSIHTAYDTLDISNQSEPREDSGICRTYYSDSMKDDDEECLMINDDSCDLDLMVEEPPNISLAIPDGYENKNKTKKSRSNIVEKAFEDIMNEPLDFNSSNHNGIIGNHLLDHEYLFFRKDSSRQLTDNNDSYNIVDDLTNSRGNKNVLSKDVLMSTGVSPMLVSENNSKPFSILNDTISSDNIDCNSKNNSFDKISFNRDCDEAIFELGYVIESEPELSIGKRKLFRDSFLSQNNKKQKMDVNIDLECNQLQIMNDLDSDNSLIEEIVFDELQPVM